VIITRPPLSGILRGGTSVPGPDSISGLQLWLKAGSFTGSYSDNQQITTSWLDSSGNARNCSVVNASGGPTFRTSAAANSQPCVQFGVSNYFTVPDFMTGYTAGHQFSVMVFDGSTFSSGEGGGAFGDVGTATDAYYPYFGNSHFYANFATNARKDDIDIGGNFTSWMCYEERSASGAWSCYRDGGSAKFSTGTNTVAFYTAACIGHCLHVTEKRLDGKVAEVIFYNKVLNGTEITTIYNYLNNKYGFSLS